MVLINIWVMLLQMVLLLILMVVVSLYLVKLVELLVLLLLNQTSGLLSLTIQFGIKALVLADHMKF